MSTIHRLARAAVLLALPTAAASLAQTAKFADSIAQRTLACVACHGQQGRAGPDGYYPRLAGKPAGYLYNQLLNFRDGNRHYGLMTGMVEPLGNAYLMEIAQHFAAQEAPYPAPAPLQVSREALQRGEQLARKGDASRQLPACVQCHGQALTGEQPATPGLLGLPRDYLNAQLGAWRTAQRRAQAPDCMATIAKRLAPDDVAAVSGWLALQVVPLTARAVAALPAVAPGNLSAGLQMECGSAPSPSQIGRAHV